MRGQRRFAGMVGAGIVAASAMPVWSGCGGSSDSAMFDNGPAADVDASTEGAAGSGGASGAGGGDASIDGTGGGGGTGGVGSDAAVDGAPGTGGSAGSGALDAATDGPGDAGTTDATMAACAPFDRKCVGTQPAVCDGNGVWQPQGSPCPFVCSAGNCTGSCVPGDVKCVHAAELTAQTCDAAGSWQTTDTCQFTCAAGACTGVCLPGDAKCSANAPVTCDGAGQWQTGAVCSGVNPVCIGGICSHF